MNKRYYVALWTKRGFYSFRTDSIELAKRIVKLSCWRVAKITDHEIKDLIFYRRTGS